MKVRFDNNDSAEVSMSPLIDCVFLLLIFFLVATMQKKIDKDIDIVLPTSTSAVKLRPDDAKLVVGVDREGRYYLEGAPVRRTELHARMRDIAAVTPDRRIRLDADADCPIHAVVELLDLCQFRGLNNVGIRTYDRSYNR